jgi:hypothetical protein
MAAKTLEFRSSGIKDLGPYPDLWAPLKAVGDSLERFHVGNNPFAELCILDLSDPRQSISPAYVAQPAEDLIEAVHESIPGARTVRVRRHVRDDVVYRQHWHTDSYNANEKVLDGGLRLRYINPLPAAPKMMVIDGPSTLGIDGVVRESSENITHLRWVPAAGLDEDPEEVFYKAINAIESTILGAMGQIVRWRNDYSDPEGDYDIVSADPGNLFENGRLALHKMPDNVPAGRTLLFTM